MLLESKTNNFSGRTHVDRSHMFWGFFVFLFVCFFPARSLISPSLAFTKSSLVFHNRLKVYLERLLVSGPFIFRSNKIRRRNYQIGRRISSDNHRPICITWSVLSNESPNRLFGGLKTPHIVQSSSTAEVRVQPISAS